MKHISVLMAALIAVLGLMGTAHAQQVDVQALVKDLQIMRQGEQGIRMVFWMPKEYWDASMVSAVPSAPQREQVLSVMDGYEVFSVMEGKIGMMGVVLGTSQADLLKKVSLQLGSSNLKPLADNELSVPMQQFIQNVKPMMASMLGQMGQNMQLLVFKGNDAQGKRILEPKAATNFKLMLGEEAFAFRLPLGSMLPALFDADTGEQYPGNYVFSPFTGKKLVAKP